ncbi:hypothetical protein BGZ65_006776, partial [Modicella reniformis]
PSELPLLIEDKHESSHGTINTTTTAALGLFYSVEQTLIIARNDAEERLNRNALKGFEHRVVQIELQAGLGNDLLGDWDLFRGFKSCFRDRFASKQGEFSPK